MLMLRPIACALVACLAWTQQAPVTFRSGIDVVNGRLGARSQQSDAGLTATDGAHLARHAGRRRYSTSCRST
jgi:hypothetical protein